MTYFAIQSSRECFKAAAASSGGFGASQTDYQHGRRATSNIEVSGFPESAHRLQQFVSVPEPSLRCPACRAQAIQIIVSVPGFQSLRCRICSARFVVGSTIDTESHTATSSAQPNGVTPTERRPSMKSRGYLGPI
jgi:hypothetical protein